MSSDGKRRGINGCLLCLAWWRAGVTIAEGIGGGLSVLRYDAGLVFSVDNGLKTG